MAITKQAGGLTATPGTPGGVLRQWCALIVVCLATLMMLIDFMAVSVVLPAIGRSTGASFSQLQWVLEAFVATLAAFVLTAGYVADLVGRRPVFLAGVGIFAIGSLLAGLSTLPMLLISGRVVQGIGGALILSTATVLLSETFRVKATPGVVAIWGTVTGLAVAFSPLVGGLVADGLGWRWIFFLEVPLALAAFFIGIVYVKEPPVGLRGAVPFTADGHAPAARRPAGTVTNYETETLPNPPDWMGLGLFTAAIAILVIGLVRTSTGSNLGTFTQNGVIALFACTVLLLIAFVAHEAVTPAPLLDISLFRHRTFTGSSIAAFGLSMAVLGPYMFLVLYLSYDLGESVLGLALRLLLLTGMTLPFLPLTGWLDRFLPMKLLICGGLALVAAGLWLMSQVTMTSTWAHLVPGMLVAGIGLELVNPRLASAAAATVKPHLAAVASRTISTFRQLGTATGVAVMGAVFASRLTGDISQAISATPQLYGKGPQIANLVLQGQVAQAANVPPGGPSDMLPIIHHAFSDAMHQIFLVAGIVALASAVLALVLRSRDLPRHEAASAGTAQVIELSAPPAGTVRTVTTPVETEPAPAFSAAASAASGAVGPGEVIVATGEVTVAVAILKIRAHLPLSTLIGPPMKPFSNPPIMPPPATATAALNGAPKRTFNGNAPTVAAAPAIEAPMAAVAGPTVEPPMVITEAVVVPPMAPVPPLVIAAVPDLDVPAPTAEEANGDLDQPKAPPDTPSLPVSSAQRLSEFLSSITYPATPAPAAANGRHNHDRVSQNHDRDGQNHDRDGQNQNGLHPDDHPGGGEHPAEAPVPALVGGPAPVRPGAAPASPGREPGETTPLIDLSARRRVSGRVTASTGEPLPGATITLVGAQGEQAGLVIAGEDGSFALGDLLEGTYTLVAAAPHYRAAASVVSLRDTEARTYVSLLGIGSLAGSITREKDGGSLEAEVELLNPAGTPVLKCRTDGGGRFILPDVLEGHYVLVVHCTSYRSHNTPVDIGRGVTRQVEVGLTGVGYVYGAVSSPGGAWVAGVPVTLRDSAGDVIATTHTDGAGSFHFPAVAEGRYTVTAAVTSSATAVIDIDAGRAVAADLTLETG